MSDLHDHGSEDIQWKGSLQVTKSSLMDDADSGGNEERA